MDVGRLRRESQHIGLNNYQHVFEVYLRYLILWRYRNTGLMVLAILEALSVLLRGIRPLFVLLRASRLLGALRRRCTVRLKSKEFEVQQPWR